MAQQSTIETIVAQYLPGLAESLEIVVSASGRYSATVAGVWLHYATEAEARQGVTRAVASRILTGQGRRSYNQDAAGYEQIMAAYQRYSNPAAETCARCGNASDSMCAMSDGGEGPHQLVTSERRISASDAAFLDRVAVHAEQGVSERD